MLMKTKTYSAGRMFSFELKKLAVSRKNWAVIAVLCVTLFLFVAYNMQQEAAERRDTAAECDFLVTWYGYKSDVYMDFYGQFGGECLKAYSDISQKRAAYFEELAAALRNDDKSATLHAKISYYTAQASYGDWLSDYAGQGRLQEDLSAIPAELSSAIFAALSPDYESFSYYSAQAEFYQNLEKTGVAPILSLHEMTGFHFLYRFITTLFPIVVLIITFLLLSDSMSSEKDSGSYKFLLLQPVSRAKLIAVKIAAGMIYAAAVILAAVLCTFLITGCANGFGSPEYPVLTDPDGYVSFSAVPSTYNKDLSCMEYGGIYTSLNMQRDTGCSSFELHGDGLHLGISPYSSQGTFRLTAPSEELTFAPIWLFLLSALPPLLFFFLLASSAAVCISAFSYNGVLSLIVCALAGVCLIPLSKLSFSPFQTANCGLLAAGLGGQTVLSSILIALAASAVLYFFTALCFRRKDIFC